MQPMSLCIKMEEDGLLRISCFRCHPFRRVLSFISMSDFAINPTAPLRWQYLCPFFPPLIHIELVVENANRLAVNYTRIVNSHDGSLLVAMVQGDVYTDISRDAMTNYLLRVNRIDETIFQLNDVNYPLLRGVHYIMLPVYRVKQGFIFYFDNQ